MFVWRKLVFIKFLSCNQKKIEQIGCLTPVQIFGYFKIHFLVRFLLNKFSHFPCQVAKVVIYSYQSVWPSASPELKVDNAFNFIFFLMHHMVKMAKKLPFWWHLGKAEHSGDLSPGSFQLMINVNTKNTKISLILPYYKAVFVI